MRYLHLLAGVATSSLVIGCTVAPDVDMTYVMPKARTLVTVTQTIGCSSGNYILSVANATITTSYVPDYDGPRGTINFNAPDSWLVDTDTGVTLTDDGRLSSINAAYTGEAAAVVKSLVALAGTFVGAAAKAVARPVPAANQSFCSQLANFVAAKPAPGGGGTPPPPTVTLTYTNQYDFQQTGDQVNVTDQFGKSYTLQAGTAVLDLPADANSSPIVTSLAQALTTGSLAFTVIASTGGQVPSQPAPVKALDASDKNVVKVPKLGLVNFVLNGPVGDLSTAVNSTVSQAVIPTRDLVSIPIGKSEPFGKITTTLTVAGSGLVNKLEYNKGSGAADLVTAATQIATQAKPQSQTAAQKAAEIQGQADQIYQQQRLIICQATPTQCPSK
jgi:hypothetical protein